MREKLKLLGTDTAIYGVSTIVGRFLSFLLTPIYANLLAPGDLGTVATLYAYIAFLNVVYGYGMETAYFKYAATGEVGDARQNFSVPFLSVLLSSLAFSYVLAMNAVPAAALARIPDPDGSLVRYAAVILALDAAAVIPFAALRRERKAWTFAAIRIAGITLNVGLNLWFLLALGWGVEGIFVSNVLSSAFVLALLIPTIVRRLDVRWHGGLYAALLRFGLPNVPAGIATMMIQVIDRPILEALTDRATVGIYQANYRLGIFMMLVVSTFDFAWRPFFLSHSSDPDAKPLFARVLTYYTLLMAAVFLTLSFFLEDIVRIPMFWGRSILPEAYWGGLPIVPVVLLAYVFLGMSGNIVAGIYIEKKTTRLPPITFLGAAVNIIANLLLIPVLGIMGAALATLLSYMIMGVVTYIVSQRIYPVEYELARIGKIAVATATVFVVWLLIRDFPLALLWKSVLLLAFVVLMMLLRFFRPSELSGLRALLTRLP